MADTASDSRWGSRPHAGGGGPVIRLSCSHGGFRLAGGSHSREYGQLVATRGEHPQAGELAPRQGQPGRPVATQTEVRMEPYQAIAPAGLYAKGAPRDTGHARAMSRREREAGLAEIRAASSANRLVWAKRSWSRMPASQYPPSPSRGCGIPRRGGSGRPRIVHDPRRKRHPKPAPRARAVWRSRWCITGLRSLPECPAATMSPSASARIPLPVPASIMHMPIHGREHQGGRAVALGHRIGVSDTTASHPPGTSWTSGRTAR